MPSLLNCAAFLSIGISLLAADPPKLIRSLSGPSGKTVDSEFVLDQVRNRFVYPNDSSMVVYFQWEAPPGDHVLTGIWKQPDGRTASISPDVKIHTSTTALNCYWIFELSAGLPSGVWSLEVRIDGAPAGSHSFEIAGMSAEPLTINQIFSSIGKSIVWVHKLDSAGSKFDMSTGFVIAPNTIATAFQSVDSAALLEIEFSDGRKVQAKEVLAFSRTGDWALVRADTGSLPVIARSDASKLLVGQRLSLFTFDSNTRVVGVVDIGGESMVNGFGARLQITPEAAREAAGGPLLDSSGRAVGIAGGSLRPGARITRQMASGNRDVREMLAHGAGGTAINAAVLISEVPAEIPSTGKTFEQLHAEGLMTPMLSPMPELFAAGSTNELRKNIATGLPAETSDFPLHGADVQLFTVWTRQGKISKGVVSIAAFDTANKSRVESPAKKVALGKTPQQLGFTFSPASLTPGTYRIDVKWDGTPVWRTFIRITE